MCRAPSRPAAHGKIVFGTTSSQYATSAASRLSTRSPRSRRFSAEWWCVRRRFLSGDWLCLYWFRVRACSERKQLLYDHDLRSNASERGDRHKQRSVAPVVYVLRSSRGRSSGCAAVARRACRTGPFLPGPVTCRGPACGTRHRARWEPVEDLSRIVVDAPVRKQPCRGGPDHRDPPEASRLSDVLSAVRRLPRARGRTAPPARISQATREQRLLHD